MTDWIRQRQTLEQMRQGITDRLNRSGNYGLDDPMGDELSELSLYDNHPGDVASELFERGKDLALLDRDKLQLEEIERALKAIDEGSYGICSSCRQPIDPERLEAHPDTTLCVDCKRADEQSHPDRTRPIEEVFLYPGFARTDTDETSNVVYDGGDAWQDVARYNERPEYEHNVEDLFMDDNEGIVDQMDRISNEDYREQLPD